MKIVFSDIMPGGIRRVIKDSGWAKDSGVEFQQPPEVSLSLILADEVTAELKGELNAIIDAQCSRCGCTTFFEVDEKFNYTFRLGKDGRHDVEDLECREEDIETVYLDKPEISIDEILLEQLILSIPEKLLCSKQCKGICPGCGALLTTEQCRCDANLTDSPFAVLKHLKK
jgi:uncharacterized protein